MKLRAITAFIPLTRPVEGDRTRFTFEYFADGAAPALKPCPLSPQLVRNSFFHFPAH